MTSVARQLGRSPVYAQNVVATSHPLATAAGIEALRAGGNAIDAAIAAAITLTVVEPTGNGVGGDTLAQIWTGDRLYGLNASGRSPKAWTPERFAHLPQMPKRGWDSVTVPGAVSAWVALSDRWGQLPFAQLFKEAIRHAEEGFAIAPHVAYWWRFYAPKTAPTVGHWQRNPELAQSLRQIADSHGEAFYRGDLAQQAIAAAQAAGGSQTLADWAEHQVEWVEPFSVSYSGAEVWALPPNSQGMITLIALELLKRWHGPESASESGANQHRLLEVVRAALDLGYRELGDLAWMPLTPAELLDSKRLDRLAATLKPTTAAIYRPQVTPTGGTVYLCTADAQGRMVSLIQSNYQGFGARVEVPGTGLTFNNRGACFVLTPEHPNQVGPQKRPFHTLTPGFLTRNGQALAAFGIMGGPLQSQAQVQLLHRLLDRGENVQAAIEAPRWEAQSHGRVRIEPGFPAATYASLTRRGHRLERLTEPRLGGGQIIWRQPQGYVAASDPRKDGQASGF
ncbi:gamma-glutamyltransferase family protein [Synechococcus elongatus]|uniref:gamma-glutamyltransferase family protein n=1 Tax=Synechococcus elongatus TaxID=32046 RepID=UPI000F7E3A4A|nr:gamma-glutamyltransferase family protein [Synechococcus elongatus]